MAQEPKYPVQTVMKALELLNHLAKNTGNLGAGVSELSAVSYTHLINSILNLLEQIAAFGVLIDPLHDIIPHRFKM